MPASAESSAWTERFVLEPTSPGALGGLKFGIKDLIDVAGRVTGAGCPVWAESHPAAAAHAPCVSLLLGSGAMAVGKTVTDVMAFSLIGENPFWGTPRNAAAPERVPGGSSSGSAAAVAAGEADFALGTDTGGSVRVPASNCGLWGWRPTHDRVPIAGVIPLAPTFDTVGVLARSAGVLGRVASVLTGRPPPDVLAPPQIDCLADFWAAADSRIRNALELPWKEMLRHRGWTAGEVTLAQLTGTSSDADLSRWHHLYSALQGLEAWSAHGAWLAAAKPDLGAVARANFERAAAFDRTAAAAWHQEREAKADALRRHLAPGRFLVFPTTPHVAPLRGQADHTRDGGGYYPLTLAFTALAGLGRLPQVTFPLGQVDGVPVGLSLVAGPDEDAALLALAEGAIKSG